MLHTFPFVLSAFIVFERKSFYHLFKSIEIKKPVIVGVFFENRAQVILLKSPSIFPRVPHYVIFSAEYHEVGHGELGEFFLVVF